MDELLEKYNRLYELEEVKRAFLGYQEGLVPLVYTNELHDIRQVLLRYRKTIIWSRMCRKLFLKNRLLDSVLLDTKNFYDNYFDIHDIEMEIGWQANKSTIAVQKQSPFALPIRLTNEFGGAIIAKLYPLLSIDIENIPIKERRVLYERIELYSFITDFTAMAYAHELAHSQVESRIGYWGGVKNFCGLNNKLWYT